MHLESSDISLLLDLLALDSPSGDEGPMADWLEAWIPQHSPGAHVRRIGDNLIVTQGTPKVALFAHLDTTGFTLGYDASLIPIGSPAIASGDGVRPVGKPTLGASASVKSSGEWVLNGLAEAPGSRYVYSAVPELDAVSIRSPYLDNRAGVYSALQCLLQCSSLAIAFTTGEEHSGNGAAVCADIVYRDLGITQALISDITWDTEHIKSGQGVAISLRDRMVPRQRFLDRVLKIAEASGITFQREIESAGGSDGGYIQRSGNPIDWVFVGAPEKRPHSSREEVAISDLHSMTQMLAALVCGLH